MSKRVKNLGVGTLGLIQQQPDGTIKQIGLSEESSNLLNLFMGSISHEHPLTMLPEEYDLTLKNKSK